MDNVKYEEDSNEMEFANNDLLSPFQSPSTSTSVGGIEAPEPKMSLLDGTFFTYVPEKSTENRIVAICMVCRPRHVEVRGFGNCSSNFLSHLKRRHGDETVLEYKNYMRCKRSRSYKHIDENRKASSPRGSAWDATVVGMQNVKETAALTQIDYGEKVNEIVLRFFISAMLPTNVVENPYFTQLFDLLAPTSNLKLLKQYNLEKRIKENFGGHISDIKQKLSDQDFVCTTIHVWTGEKEHFVGIAAHSISPDLRRFSTPLACRGIKYKNYNAFLLSQLVREIHEDFGISCYKLVGTVAGNSSDFLRAFKIFGVQLTNILISEQQDLEDCILFDTDDANMYEENEQKILSSACVPLDPNILPIPLKCCSNILITAITNAIYEELNYSNNTPLSNIHATTINKCNILWQAAGNPKLSEIIENYINTKLKRPNFADWTSLNSALQQILSIKEKSATLHKALNLQNPISENEFFYLQEYLTCTGPIVEALGILQSEQNTFYGMVMPCLFALRRNLMKIVENMQFYYCQNLINSYIAHVTSAFNDFFDLNTETAQSAAFAALSFPRFKNQWLVCVTDEQQRQQVLTAFKLVVSKEINLKFVAETQPTEKSSRESDFFNFDPDFGSDNAKSKLQRSMDAPLRKAEVQVLQFFAEEITDLAVLYSYPEIKRVFIKYNTSLPSLATGESLFHFPTMNNLRRNPKTFNELLEKRLILNANINRNQF